MKNKMLPATLGFMSLTFLFFFVSCRKDNKIDTEFYIPVERSRLYVRVVGNAAKPLIIDLHGGPGAFAGFDHEFYRKHLEDDYLIVYLDQRGGGKSDVCKDTFMLTPEQFVEDLDAVVDTFRRKYPGKKINLLGASWGGTLGLLYLTAHQEKITSFVCTSGKANSIYQYHSLIRHERELANALLVKSDDPASKQRYKEILTKLNKIEKSGFKRFFDNMNLIKHTFPDELGFNAYWADSVAEARAVKLGEDSAVYKRAHYTKEEFDAALQKMEFVNEVFHNDSTYNNLNILDELTAIHKPVSVIQGEYDYNVGIKQANLIYDALKGVPESKKELHIIPNAAHNLNMEAEDTYFHLVKSFFDKYN